MNDLNEQYGAFHTEQYPAMFRYPYTGKTTLRAPPGIVHWHGDAVRGLNYHPPNYTDHVIAQW